MRITDIKLELRLSLGGKERGGERNGQLVRLVRKVTVFTALPGKLDFLKGRHLRPTCFLADNVTNEAEG
jgi:hypothetical protein